ncbi:hypothetical protein [Photorhabdus sp. CRCIA-P01]|uniref:hypothetical protein n=1 Tax=Photorhabdus sp. CRCIA-P01 TaxID=2019570 RepID=UPI00130062C4|nr:hypothetical protein [Photorhabdus sp. CRCIA-P01]
MEILFFYINNNPFNFLMVLHPNPAGVGHSAYVFGDVFKWVGQYSLRFDVS